jgi:hypothetical protein
MPSESVRSCQIRSGVAAMSALTAHSRRKSDVDDVATIEARVVTRPS